jgi:hypothetical protein
MLPAGVYVQGHRDRVKSRLTRGRPVSETTAATRLSPSPANRPSAAALGSRLSPIAGRMTIGAKDAAYLCGPADAHQHAGSVRRTGQGEGDRAAGLALTIQIVALRKRTGGVSDGPTPRKQSCVRRRPGAIGVIQMSPRQSRDHESAED